MKFSALMVAALCVVSGPIVHCQTPARPGTQPSPPPVKILYQHVGGGPNDDAFDAEVSHGGLITQGLQLGILGKKQSYSAEEPIVLDVQLRNSRDRDVSFEEQGASVRGLNIVIKDQTGQDVPLTAFGKHLYEKPAAGKNAFAVSRMVTIPPGKQITYHLWLNRVFDLSAAATYTISVKKNLLDKQGPVSVVSNTTIINVFEPTSAPYASLAVPDQPERIGPPVGSFQIRF